MSEIVYSAKLDPSASLKASAPGNARVGPIRAIPSVLKEFGISAHRAFTIAGISPKTFADDDNRVSLLLLARLFSTCVQLTQCEHFGLLVGERFDLTRFGPIGYLMRNSPTVGDALRSLVQSLHLHDQGGVPVLLALDEKRMLLGYSIYQSGPLVTDQIYDVVTAIVLRILSELCGPQWKPLTVQLSHKQPSDTVPYRRLFHSRVSYDAEISGIVFDSAWMQQTIQGADPILNALLSRLIHDADAKYFPLLKDRVLRVLRQMLLSGTFSSSAVAELFGVHERTLRRRLDAEGTSLQQLVNQTRFDLAKELLENTALPVAEIAAALQYADPNAFSRAFRSWANLSPNQWRKSLQLESEGVRWLYSREI